MTFLRKMKLLLLMTFFDKLLRLLSQNFGLKLGLDIEQKSHRVCQADLD